MLLFFKKESYTKYLKKKEKELEQKAKVRFVERTEDDDEDFEELIEEKNIMTVVKNQKMMTIKKMIIYSKLMRYYNQIYNEKK